ncbi:MAG: hypothetical protein PHH59_00085 [Methylovulum sp.]|uniref:hypothetical protein n=1 Tax=Methylovulum sp. TaxID=1916980 RepID=UPI002633A9EC|nr:hypothetical protein [Methylovulum sp.]MDD2722406.1 hypothetical protein [Methylovulum sp.]
MKKLLKYLAVAIGGGLMMIFIAYLGLIGWLQWKFSDRYPYNASPLQGMHTINTLPLRYKIGSYRLNIPVNYTIRTTDILPSNIIDGIDVISVLWPDLEPYSEKNRAEFEHRRKITNKIFLSLTQTKWYRPDGAYDPNKVPAVLHDALTPEQACYSHIYHFKQRGIEGTYVHDSKVPEEFIYYPEWDNEKKPVLGNKYAVLDKGHCLYSVRCDGAESDHSPWTSRHCESFLKYNDEIYVRYEFDFNLLKDWRQIELKIRELVASFERAAATEKP